MGHVERTEEAQPNIQSQVESEAVNGEKTVAELASGYKARPGQIEAWKKVLMGVSGVFNWDRDKGQKYDEALVARLYQQIGQLKVERDFLAERSGP